MTYIQSHSHQSAFRAFARVDHWRAPHAVTLTMKQCDLSLDGQQGYSIYLDAQKASQNFRHFLNLLNRAALGKGATRHGRRIRLIAVLEGGKARRLHYHAALDCPRDDLVERFPSMITEAWRNTQFGHCQIDIQRDADAGWINYISKLRDKPDYADAIDWVNYHNAD